jgi:hypothetical protein
MIGRGGCRVWIQNLITSRRLIWKPGDQDLLFSIYPQITQIFSTRIPILESGTKEICGRKVLRDLLFLLARPLPNKQEDGSHRDFDHRFGNRTGNRFTVLLQTFKVTLNGIADVCHGFIASLSLRNATGQSRVFGNKYTILIRFDGDTEFHTDSLPSEHHFAMQDRQSIRLKHR